MASTGPVILPRVSATQVHDAPSAAPTTRKEDRLTVAGLFAGIGGIELGLHRAGHTTRLLCENDTAATQVLQEQFPGVETTGDICGLDRLPDVSLVTAGFPCQDLSQAGRTAGIDGMRSGLVEHVFRLLEDPRVDPRWLLLENVPFMLRLQRGQAMRYLTKRLEDLRFRWAYRVVDTRAFGLPQRRQRVLLLASRHEDPRPVLFGQDAEPFEPDLESARACGFYWTEGLRGLGWAVEGVPTLKGGSTVGIPSPPAIWWRKSNRVDLPDIRDAERLQGFPTDWTLPAMKHVVRKNGPRWKLVGNAVSVPVAEWIGRRLAQPATDYHAEERRLADQAPWPTAAYGAATGAVAVNVSEWPERHPYEPLSNFLEHPTTPLSVRATKGFLSRAAVAKLRFPEGFVTGVGAHLSRMEAATA